MYALGEPLGSTNPAVAASARRMIEAEPDPSKCHQRVEEPCSYLDSLVRSLDSNRIIIRCTNSELIQM